MSYHHSKYAGNAGDVWKHFCLLETVKGVVAGTGSRSRSYFESHCGSGWFRLEEEEEWKRGIGHSKPIPPELSTTDYFETAFHHLAMREYLGSWRWTESTGAFSRFFLCDSNPEVIAAAKRALAEETNFHFAVADGFEKLATPEKYDFVFIDPPYVAESPSDWERLQQLLPSLIERQKHFLVWYPIFGKNPASDVFKGLERFEIVWDKSPDAKKMVGCGITGSQPCTAILRNHRALPPLATWLSASFRYCK